MKTMTRLGKGVIGAVVSFALFIGCLPITAIPVLAAEGDTPATITLGGSSTYSDYHMPIRTDRAHSVSEQIYTASELGNAGGTISSIAFYSTGAVSRNIRVYLVDTSKTSFTSNTNWIKEGTLCYEGSVSFSSNAWTTINFSTTFAHTATSNLAVIVIDYTGSNATQRNFRCYAGSSNQCIYARGNNAYTLNTLNANGTLSSYKPVIQISILKNMTVTAPDVEVDWDGDAHGLTVTATDAGSGATISGATVMYSETEGGPYDQSSLEYTDAGTYDIYYQVKASGYATVTGSATIVINEASETYTWDSSVISTINVSNQMGGTTSYTHDGDGITVSRTGNASFRSNQISGYNGSNNLTFTAPDGSIFTSIVITVSGNLPTNAPTGWTKDGKTLVWTPSEMGTDTVTINSTSQYGIT